MASEKTRANECCNASLMYNVGMRRKNREAGLHSGNWLSYIPQSVLKLNLAAAQTFTHYFRLVKKKNFLLQECKQSYKTEFSNRNICSESLLFSCIIYRDREEKNVPVVMMIYRFCSVSITRWFKRIL